MSGYDDEERSRKWREDLERADLERRERLKPRHPSAEVLYQESIDDRYSGHTMGTGAGPARDLRKNASSEGRRYFEAQAAWDESHIQPAVEYMHELGDSATAALKRLEEDIDDEQAVSFWKVQNSDAIEEFGMDPDDAFKIWRETYLSVSRQRLARELAREGKTDNARSMMTGPAWDSARRKLASAAAPRPVPVPSKNPCGGKRPNAPATKDRDVARTREILRERDRLAIECAPGCMGWFVSDTDRGLSVEACDECNAEARRVGEPTLTDAQVKKLPEAKREHRRMRGARYQEIREAPPPGPVRMGGGDLNDNPAPSPEERRAAVDKYEEFHRYAPTKIGDFPSGFQIPKKLVKVGRALWTTYRSPKVDPSTLKRPRGPVDYIHEHDAGVYVYLPVASDIAAELEDPEIVTVPDEFTDVGALVCLGQNLGFCFTIHDYEAPVEAEGVDPLPELYCTPDGRCLLVVQSKREVMAMIWGGALGVFARGIDG